MAQLIERVASSAGAFIPPKVSMVWSDRCSRGHVALGWGFLSHLFRPEKELLVNVEIHRILFPTDFSPSAQQAQNYACSLAEKFSAELHALHVVPDPLPVPGPEGSWILPDTSVPRLAHEAELELAIRMEAALTGDLVVVRSVHVGQPVQAIIDYAKEHEIDLIVIGTHGHTGLSRMLLGSIAEKVVRLAACPVLTVHPKDHLFRMNETPKV